MANPNLVNVTTIYGNTSTTLLTTTANPFATAIVNNAASSGKVYKVNSIVVANLNGVSAIAVTIKIFSEDDLGGTGTAIASTIPIPANSSLVVVDKTNSFYLMENKSIGATSASANDLVVTASWEELNS